MASIISKLVTTADAPPLYKFLSLDRGLSPPWEDRLSQILVGRCYLSSAADFNDPFDCLPRIYLPEDRTEFELWKEQMIPAMAAAIRRDIPAWFVEQEVRSALAGVDASQVQEKLRLSMTIMADKIGVFCLAERIDSVLMWSHYASNHRGVAVIFQFSARTLADLYIWKVAYSDERPVVRDIHAENPKSHLADALAMKAKFWEYEQEWRIMKTEQARSFLQIDQSVISGLVFGARCTADDEAAVRQMAEGRNLAYYRMVPDEHTFDMNIQSL